MPTYHITNLECKKVISFFNKLPIKHDEAEYYFIHLLVELIAKHSILSHIEQSERVSVLYQSDLDLLVYMYIPNAQHSMYVLLKKIDAKIAIILYKYIKLAIEDCGKEN